VQHINTIVHQKISILKVLSTETVFEYLKVSTETVHHWLVNIYIYNDQYTSQSQD